MATITHKLQQSVKSSSGSTSLSGYDAETGNSEIGVDETFPAASTNATLTLALTVANLQAVFIVCSQNCTLKTNSTSSPGNTLNLVAGIPLAWGVSSGLANPFTSNVTVVYVTCSPACRVQMKILTG